MGFWSSSSSDFELLGVIDNGEKYILVLRQNGEPLTDDYVLWFANAELPRDIFENKSFELCILN